MNNEEEFYLSLNGKELNWLRGVVRDKLKEGVQMRDWETAMCLYESLIGARMNLSSVREIDKAVKKTRVYTALYNLGYFDYEEDFNDSTFYDLVCFLDDSGHEVFEEIANELKEMEAKNAKNKDEQSGN